MKSEVEKAEENVMKIVEEDNKMRLRQKNGRTFVEVVEDGI